MAKKVRPKESATAHSKETFAEILLKIGDRFSVPRVFDDFLTLAIAAFTPNPATNLSWYEEEYMQTIGYYKGSELRHLFPKAAAKLTEEMGERRDSPSGNDVLGEFFEEHISYGRNGQLFSHYSVCAMNASLIAQDLRRDREGPIKVFDTCCGSGRLLIAFHKALNSEQGYYGIDIDRRCVQMAALNLFLNEMWNSEVMCANVLKPYDFVISYVISSNPRGIFKIEKPENSVLWDLHQQSFQ